MLTPQEQMTLDAYTVLAAQRNQRFADPTTWEAEYRQFTLLCPQGQVVDLGCGSGRDALLITNHHYLGLDLSEPMLAEARKLAPNAAFIQGDLYDLPLSSSSVDGIWAAASLLHVPRLRIHEPLAEIRRVLKPDGLFFCVMRKGTGEHVIPGSEPGTDRFFCFWEEPLWSQLLADQGFVLLCHHEREIGGRPWLVTFATKKA